MGRSELFQFLLMGRFMLSMGLLDLRAIEFVEFFVMLGLLDLRAIEFVELFLLEW